MTAEGPGAIQDRTAEHVMRTDPSIPPPILPARPPTVPDVCALVQAKQWFVHAEVKRGRLRALKVGGTCPLRSQRRCPLDRR